MKYRRGLLWEMGCVGGAIGEWVLILGLSGTVVFLCVDPLCSESVASHPLKWLVYPLQEAGCPLNLVLLWGVVQVGLMAQH